MKYIFTNFTLCVNHLIVTFDAFVMRKDNNVSLSLGIKEKIFVTENVLSLNSLRCVSRVRKYTPRANIKGQIVYIEKKVS